MEINREMGMTIERPEYIKWLEAWREKQIIKVISGVRRCGKSTLLEIYKNNLLKDGVNQNQIISVNFEDLEYEELSDYKALYQYLRQRLVPGRMNYIFLDEIQHCAGFEKAVDSLFIRSDCDVHITGSNSYFMSSELATLLSGRYVELKMLPLSFKEFSMALDDSRSDLTKEQRFNLYLEYGSFPYIVKYNRFGQEAKDYLAALYATILLNDVVKRCSIEDVSSLEDVTKFMLHNVGNRTSSIRISNTLKSAGRSVDQKTVDKYMSALAESLLFYPAWRFNLKGRQILSTQRKYYVVDTGLRALLVRGQNSDIGHILENVVFLELFRRGNDVYIGEIKDKEVDFVAIRNGAPSYFQVAATTLEPSTLERELSPLWSIKDNYPKHLLTLDSLFANEDYKGVRKTNVIDWLLE